MMLADEVEKVLLDRIKPSIRNKIIIIPQSVGGWFSEQYLRFRDKRIDREFMVEYLSEYPDNKEEHNEGD